MAEFGMTKLLGTEDWSSAALFAWLLHAPLAPVSCRAAPETKNGRADPRLWSLLLGLVQFLEQNLAGKGKTKSSGHRYR